jgi:hypothetical protein
MARRDNRKFEELQLTIERQSVVLGKIAGSLEGSIKATNAVRDAVIATNKQENTNNNSEAAQLKEIQKEVQNNVVWVKLTQSYTKIISDGWKNAEANQKASLRIGLTANELNTQTKGSIDRMSGDMMGFQGAFGVALDQYYAGLRGTNASMDRLGAATAIAGGDTRNLYKQIAKNTEGMGFSQSEMSRLADTTLSLNQGFGIESDRLVQAVGELGDQLSEFMALGVGADMQEASMRLAAALGPELAGLGPQLLGSFTKGSSMVQASLLGVSRERVALIKGEGDATRNAFDLIMKAGTNAERLVEKFTNGAKDPAFALEKAANIYGREAIQAIRAKEAIEQAARDAGLSTQAYIKSVQEQKEIDEKFKDTFRNFKDRVLAPFMQAMTRMANVVHGFIGAVGNFGVFAGQVIFGLGGVLLGYRLWTKGFVKLWSKMKWKGLKSVLDNFQNRLPKRLGGLKGRTGVGPPSPNMLWTEKLVNFAKGVRTAVGTFFQSTLPGWWAGLKTGAAAAWQGIAAKATWAWGWIVKIFMGIFRGFGTALKWLVTKLPVHIWTGLSKFVGPALKTFGKAVFGFLWLAAKAAVASIFAFFGVVLSPLALTIATVVAVVATIGALVYAFWDEIKAFFSKIGSWLAGVWNSISGFFSKLWSKMPSWLGGSKSETELLTEQSTAKYEQIQELKAKSVAAGGEDTVEGRALALQADESRLVRYQIQQELQESEGNTKAAQNTQTIMLALTDEIRAQGQDNTRFAERAEYQRSENIEVGRVPTRERVRSN